PYCLAKRHRCGICNGDGIETLSAIAQSFSNSSGRSIHHWALCPIAPLRVKKVSVKKNIRQKDTRQKPSVKKLGSSVTTPYLLRLTNDATGSVI
ncbi:MAG: hypothetical protein AAGF66_02105, partial [Cyanobacteria bacterium P01_H01_bin.119]